MSSVIPILTLAVAMFVFGGIAGVLLTLAVGIHSHKRTNHATRPVGVHLTAARQILGVGPLNNDKQRS
jgi:hypothetical protein